MSAASVGPKNRLRRALEKILVAIRRHPFRTLKMRVIGAFRAFRLPAWIDSKDDFRYFFPSDAFLRGVEQPQIDDRMSAIIVDDMVVSGRDVGDGASLGGRHDSRIQKVSMF